MNDQQRRLYVEILLQQGISHAEALQRLGTPFITQKIDYDDYLAMAEMLGFEIRDEELYRIERSIARETIRIFSGSTPARVVQKPMAQA
ncbi:MAG: hypothetical protein SPL80_10145 [Bacilli bacterium]|nr:hypothetical protein [Bacilli bacterium]